MRTSVASPACAGATPSEPRQPAAITRSLRRPRSPLAAGGVDGACHHCGGRLGSGRARHHDVRMRTTLILDDDIAAFLREQAQLHDKPFRQVVNETLRRSMPPPAGQLPSDGEPPRRPYRVPTFTRIHRSKLDGAGGRAAGEFVGVQAFAGRCRSEEPSLSVAQRGSGALRAPARGCARRARACWREPRTRVGAVSERQAGSGNARNRARAAAHWPAQGQRFARCRVQRRAEWVSRPARAK